MEYKIKIVNNGFIFSKDSITDDVDTDKYGTSFVYKTFDEVIEALAQRVNLYKPFKCFYCGAYANDLVKDLDLCVSEYCYQHLDAIDTDVICKKCQDLCEEKMHEYDNEEKDYAN